MHLSKAPRVIRLIENTADVHAKACQERPPPLRPAIPILAFPPPPASSHAHAAPTALAEHNEVPQQAHMKGRKTELEDNTLEKHVSRLHMVNTLG